MHPLWQDPYGLYTTLFMGINPDLGFFVGADPVLHSPTKFFISVEFKDAAVQAIGARGWHVWERDRRAGEDEPVEVLVGGTAESLLRYFALERDALGEDQGIAISSPRTSLRRPSRSPPFRSLPDRYPAPGYLARAFPLARPLEGKILDLIA